MERGGNEGIEVWGEQYGEQGQIRRKGTWRVTGGWDKHNVRRILSPTSVSRWVTEEREREVGELPSLIRFHSRQGAFVNIPRKAKQAMAPAIQELTNRKR